MRKWYQTIDVPGNAERPLGNWPLRVTELESAPRYASGSIAVFVFSTRRTASMTMALSTALHMS